MAISPAVLAFLEARLRQSKGNEWRVFDVVAYMRYLRERKVRGMSNPNLSTPPSVGRSDCRLLIPRVISLCIPSALALSQRARPRLPPKHCHHVAHLSAAGPAAAHTAPMAT